MISGRPRVKSWTGILRFEVGVRDILSSFWSLHLLLLEHFLMVLGTVGKRLLWYVIRSSWGVHEHLSWAQRCLILIRAPDLLLHRLIKRLLTFIGWLPISLPLLSSVKIALCVGLNTRSLHFPLLLAWRHHWFQPRCVLWLLYMLRTSGRPISLLSVRTLISRCFTNWAIQLLWIILLRHSVLLKGANISHRIILRGCVYVLHSHLILEFAFSQWNTGGRQMVSMIDPDFTLSLFQGLHLGELRFLLLAEAWRYWHSRDLFRLLRHSWFREIEHVGTAWSFMIVWNKMVSNLERLGVETATHGLVEALDRWLEWFGVIHVMEEVFLSVIFWASFTMYAHWERRLGHRNPSAFFLTLWHVHEARCLVMSRSVVEVVHLVGILMIRIVRLDHMTRIPVLIHKLVLKLPWAWTVWSWRGLTRAKWTELSRSLSIIHHLSILLFLFKLKIIW